MIRRGGGPILIGFFAHAEIQFAAGDNIGVGKPGTGQFLAVKFGGLDVHMLDVHIFMRVIFCDDSEGGAGSRVAYLRTAYQWATDHIHAGGGIDWIKTQSPYSNCGIRVDMKIQRIVWNSKLTALEYFSDSAESAGFAAG